MTSVAVGEERLAKVPMLAVYIRAKMQVAGATYVSNGVFLDNNKPSSSSSSANIDAHESAAQPGPEPEPESEPHRARVWNGGERDSKIEFAGRAGGGGRSRC